MFVTGDPLEISLLLTLGGVGLDWSDITEEDDSDASYKRALDIVIAAGLVDGKVEVTAEMQDRLGQLTATYHCHGGCDVLLNEDIGRHACNFPDWIGDDGNLAASLIIHKRVLAVRLSARSIEEFKVDRKTAVVPMLIKKLLPRIDSGEYWDQSPEIELMEINLSASSGPDPASPGVFYWRGTGHTLTQRNWKMLQVIWGHTEVSIGDVAELVWGSYDTQEATIRSQLNRLNSQMADLDIPLAWRCDNGRVVPEA